MTPSVAVMFVHGVETAGQDYADAAVTRLRRAFAREADLTAHEAASALEIRACWWVPVLDEQEDKLLAATSKPMTRRRQDQLLEGLTGLISAGGWLALLPLGVLALARRAVGSRVNFPGLRWFAGGFAGDAIGYQVTPSSREVYDRIHDRLHDTLAELAAAAGEDAPLCVIAHSLGSVLASDHFYDLDTGHAAFTPTTPLARGETLLHLYTLGSPLALWALRYPDFGVPLTFPGKGLDVRFPDHTPTWINFYDPDDLVAYPLRGLTDAYAASVTEDREVSVGPGLLSATPLAHPYYWHDDDVIDPIAAELAGTWHRLNGSRTP